MAVDIPKSALDGTPASEPDLDYPDFVEIKLCWGRKERVHRISANEFFGRSGYGAPLPADAIVQHINRLRRMGRPE